MSVALSHRASEVMLTDAIAELGMRRRDFAIAVDTADSEADLPVWVREVLLLAEAELSDVPPPFVADRAVGEYVRDEHGSFAKSLEVKTGPATGFPEGYDPNKPQADGLFSKNDKLYWVAASTDRLREIRDSVRNPGSLGNRMLQIIASGPLTEEPLLRGARIRTVDADVARDYQPGRTIDLNLTSFTTDRAEAERYVTGLRSEGGALRDGDQPVLVTLDPGAAAMRIGESFGGTTTDEFVSAGRYMIDKVESATLGNGAVVPHVTISQFAIFEPPTEQIGMDLEPMLKDWQ